MTQKSKQNDKKKFYSNLKILFLFIENFTNTKNNENNKNV